MRKRKPITYSRNKSGGIRWRRVFAVLLVFVGICVGGWQLTRPSAPAIEAATTPPERREMVMHEGKWLLPGEVPKAETKAEMDADLASAILAREKQKAEMAAITNGTAAGPVVEAPKISIVPTKQNPYAGKTLQQIIGDIATYKFIGKSPQEWGEHIAGVTSYLSHVWTARNMLQEQVYGASPMPTVKPVAGAKATIALTLDACGGKAGADYDAELIDFLRERQIKATLFFTSSWLKKNTMLARVLARDPLFEIAAHGVKHKPASIDGREAYGNKGTASLAELVREVEGNARDIEEVTGKRPRWFRSGTAYYDDIAVAVIRQLGFGIAGFSIAGDAGATLPADKVAAKVLAAQDGDILLLHMNKPKSGTRKGLMEALPLLQERGVVFVHLSE